MGERSWAEALRGRPLVGVAAALILGITLYAAVPSRPAMWAGCAGLLAVGAMLAPWAGWRDACLACGITLAGVSAAQLAAFRFPESHIALYLSEEPALAQVEVRVNSAPRIVGETGAGWSTGRQVARGEVLAVLTRRGWTEASGTILLQLAEPHEGLKLGQRLRVFGMLHRPARAANPGQFDWSEYYRRERVLAAVEVAYARNVSILEEAGAHPLHWVQTKAREALARGFAPSSAMNLALLRALVLGDSDPQLRDVQELFIRTGTSHHLAISGMHVALVAAAIYGLARLVRIRPRGTAWIGLGTAIAYGLVVLPSAPVVRSVLLCAAAGVGTLSGRRGEGVQLLCLSVIAMLLYDPLDLFGAGFQLSFGTVLGLMLLTGPAVESLASLRDRDVAVARSVMKTTWVGRGIERIRGGIVYALVAGVIAWAVSAPLVAFHFNQANPWAIPGSLLLGMPVAGSLLMGLMKIIGSACVPWTAPLLARATEWPIQAMVGCVEGLTRLPGADWPMPSPAAAGVAACYAMLAAPLVMRRWAGKFDQNSVARWKRRMGMGWGVAAASVVLVFLPTGSSELQPGTMRLTLLSVGAGQCAVLHLPSGKTVLIDGGSATGDCARTCLLPYLKRMGIGRLDRVFISHANVDHYSAVEKAMARCGPGVVHISPAFLRHAEKDAGAAALLTALRRTQCGIEMIRPGMRIALDEATWAEALWPPEELVAAANESSVVLRITCRGKTILLPGDIDESAQRAMLREPERLRCDVLVAPHHGSLEEPTGAFLAATGAQHVLASNGRRLSRKQRAFDEAAGQVERTHVAGAIAVEVDRAGSVRIQRFLEKTHKP